MALALVSIGCALAIFLIASFPYIARLAWDPWIETWRVPGRTLLLVAMHTMPVVFLWTAGIGLIHYLRRPRTQSTLSVVFHFFVVGFLLLDSAVVIFTERHVFAEGQLAFLLQEGALSASGIMSPARWALGAIGVTALALLLRRIAPLVVTGLKGSLACFALSMIILYAIDTLYMPALVFERPLYLTAISSTPFPRFGELVKARRLGLVGQPLYQKVPGLRSLSNLLIAPPQIESLAERSDVGRQPLRPRVILLFVVDGWRYDHLSPTASPNLHRLAVAGGQLEQHYTSVAGTDRSIYSMLYGRHGFSAETDLRVRQRDAPLLKALRRDGYESHAFDTSPEYRYLDPLYQQFDAVHRGPHDTPSPAGDSFIAGEITRLVSQRAVERPLFIFALFSSTHFPYMGDPTLPPHEGYGKAVRFVDELIGRLISDLGEAGVSYSAIITADHGTEFGDCGGIGYSNANAYTLHVPLVVTTSPDLFDFSRRIRSVRWLTTHAGLAALFVREDTLAPALDDPGGAGARVNIGFANAGTLVSEIPLIHDGQGNVAFVELEEGNVRFLYLGNGPCPETAQRAGTADRFFARALHGICEFESLPCQYSDAVP